MASGYSQQCCRYWYCLEESFWAESSLVSYWYWYRRRRRLETSVWTKPSPVSYWYWYRRRRRLNPSVWTESSPVVDASVALLGTKSSPVSHCRHALLSCWAFRKVLVSESSEDDVVFLEWKLRGERRLCWQFEIRKERVPSLNTHYGATKRLVAALPEEGRELVPLSYPVSHVV